MKLNLTILLVDDDPDFRGFVAEILAAHNCRVIEAGTLRDAKKTTDIDLALLDHALPDGSGIDLIKHFAGQGIPTVYVTGSSDEKTMARAAKAGARAYLTKQIKPEDLIAAITTAQHTQQEAITREATGILQVQHKCSPPEALEKIQQESMRTRQPATEVAKRIIRDTVYMNSL